MPLESATYISDLVVSNPANSDGLNQADDHMRLIKATVKATFPNFTSAALSSTQANIDAAVAAVVTRPNATVPAGAVMDFAMATAPAGWLECNGAAVSRTTYAALFTAIGTTWGAGDGSTTFNLPPDRYRVGKNTAGAAVGTLQASQNKAHNHAVNGAPSVGTLGTVSAGDHFHAAGISDPGHSHGHNMPGNVYNSSTAGNLAGGSGAGAVALVISSNTTGVRVNSSNGLDTTYTAGAHIHTVNGAPGVGTLGTVSDGGTDSRPLSAVFLTCIKV